MIKYYRVFFWPVLTTDIRSCSQCQKVCFFPIWIRKFQIQGTKKKGRKNNKISPFYDVYVCGWKSGSEQSELYKGNNQILQTPKR